MMATSCELCNILLQKDQVSACIVSGMKSLTSEIIQLMAHQQESFHRFVWRMLWVFTIPKTWSKATGIEE